MKTEQEIRNKINELTEDKTVISIVTSNNEEERIINIARIACLDKQIELIEWVLNNKENNF